MVKAYIYKLMHSPLLYIGIIVIAALCCTNYLFGDFGYGSVLYHVKVFIGLAQYRRSLAIFGALPFTANFADEWTSGVVKECIVRKGIKKYAATNLILCWFCAMLTVFLGMLLFMFFDSLFVPWSTSDPNPYFCIFEEYI